MSQTTAGGNWLSIREVAAKLDLSTKTVEYHKYHMMQQQGIRTSAELIQYAIKHGIVTL